MLLPARIFILSISLFILSLSPFPFPLHPVHAFDPIPSTLSPSPSTDHHLYTQQVVLDLTSALTCQLVGIDPTGQKCLTYDLNGKLSFLPSPTTNDQQQVGGAVGLMSGLISTLYTPPASSGDYFRYLANNFGVVKPAYAQGIGFKGLTPLLPVWTVFRNLAYVLFVIAFVVIGFAIMLRVRIDPRTVMTIQNQIPKLIIALLLVTFSFAIAGFLIDLMYVTIYLLFNVAGIALPSLKSDFNTIANQIQGQNPFEVINNLFGVKELAHAPAGAISQLIGPFFDNAPGKFITGFVMGIAGKFLGSMAADVISGVVSIIPGVGLPAKIISNFTLKQVLDALGGAAGITIGVLATKQVISFVGFLIAFLIIVFAVLWSLFRLWFALIQAYIFILIDIVFAPLWVLAGVLPGGTLSFGSWMRDIVANLSAFPTTIAMFLLGKIFIESFKTTGGFYPPLIGPLYNPELLSSLIAVGIILMTPQVVNMMRDTLKAPQFKYTAAIGQAVGVGTGVITAPTQPITQAATFLGGQQFIKGVPGIGKWFGGP